MWSRKFQNGIPFLVLVSPPSHTVLRLPHSILNLDLTPVIMFLRFYNWKDSLEEIWQRHHAKIWQTVTKFQHSSHSILFIFIKLKKTMRYLPLLPVVSQIPLFPTLKCPCISGIPPPFLIFFFTSNCWEGRGILAQKGDVTSLKNSKWPLK